MNETIYPDSSMIEPRPYGHRRPEPALRAKSAPSAGKYFLANIKGQY